MNCTARLQHRLSRVSGRCVERTCVQCTRRLVSDAQDQAIMRIGHKYQLLPNRSPVLTCNHNFLGNVFGLYLRGHFGAHLAEIQTSKTCEHMVKKNIFFDSEVLCCRKLGSGSRYRSKVYFSRQAPTFSDPEKVVGVFLAARALYLEALAIAVLTPQQLQPDLLLSQWRRKRSGS